MGAKYLACRRPRVLATNGEGVADIKPGRENKRERTVFWHQVYVISDIMAGHLVYEKAKARDIGTGSPATGIRVTSSRPARGVHT